MSKEELTSPPPPAPKGAVHSAEIEYALGNLATNQVYQWTAEDYRLSELFQQYYTNFVKRGDPNGSGLPQWPPTNQGDTIQVMQLDVEAHARPEQHRARYRFLDQIFRKNS